MSLAETQAFLEDLLLRFDPDIDVSAGSRAQTDLVDPILSRIGPDPFDENVPVFVRDRIRQVYPDLAIADVDDLTDTLINPMMVLIEPLTREIKLTKLRSSLRNIESLSDDEVDALMANFFESRITGGYALGVVRVYFSAPQSVSLSYTSPGTTRSGLRFFPTRPQQITSDQMLLNVDGSEYYFDVNYTAEQRGDEYNVEAGEIVSVGNLPTITRVTNLRRFRNGVPRETSIEFAARAEAGQSDKTLTVQPGIIRTLGEAFPALRRLFVIGFRDPEMERDVITGGSLGEVPGDDLSGAFYGTATAIDDLNGDLSTAIIEVATGVGAFVTRLGAAGALPDGWFMTLIYTDTALRVVDAQVLEVISSTRVRLDHEINLTVATGGITWALRRQQLTITDIPGGITLPDTAAGTLEITSNAVHVGGRTDIYVAGETEAGTAQITSLTDESPVARGVDAQTSADDTVDLDVATDPSLIEAGMSLVLEEGADAGPYLITEVVSVTPALPAAGPYVVDVRLDQTMTGTQANLAWKVVDEIDSELTDPKNVKAAGSDLVTISGSSLVTTTSAFNFTDATVQTGDVLEISGDELAGGDYTITAVSATALEVDPAVPNTLGAAAFRVFTRSEAVETPVLRVSSMELLDSSGAPVGTEIPYRDPVLAVSGGFGNEGSRLVYNDRALIGLVTTGVATTAAAFAVGSLTITWEAYDPIEVWAGPYAGTYTFTFSGGLMKTATEIVTEINADGDFASQNVRAVVLTYGDQDYVGLTSSRLIIFTGGTAVIPLGLVAGVSNAVVRPLPGISATSSPAWRQGDLIEIGEGNNAATTSRIIASTATAPYAVFGDGPVGPAAAAGAVGITGVTRLYNNTLFLPDAGAKVRVGRPSVGSARTYYLAPTSAEFDFGVARYSVEADARTLTYRPDPENTRTVLPAPPTTAYPATGVTTATTLFTDASADFRNLRIQPGDLLEVLYMRIVGTAPLSAVSDTLVGGLTLVLRLDAGPFITISFPFDMARQAVADYINERVGEDIASLEGTGELVLQPAASLLEISDTSTALAVLFLSAGTNEADGRGQYVISRVTDTAIVLSSDTPYSGTLAVVDVQYRIYRHMQRISSTEMQDNQDASGLYYADVELLSAGPGNGYNIASGLGMAVTGARGDGYRLSTDNPVLSYSRAEVLRAEISRTILLPGSSDSPAEYVQLSQQNVQINYDRSQLTDAIQSFVDSDQYRVICEDILVRHLLPHYVLLNWAYVGGQSEPVMVRALEDLLDTIEPDTELETDDLVKKLRSRGATSVYTPDATHATGRTAPLFIVIHHNADRSIGGLLVTDFVDTVRTQRYIPDTLTLRRVSTAGIR